MFILRIEHRIGNYDGWKSAFDSDPVDREKSGVIRHRVMRASDDENHVMIDLEFKTKKQAEALLAGLRTVWSRVEGKIMFDPQARVVECVESIEY